MIYILSSVLDNQKASKNSFQATTFNVEENSRTFQGLAQNFKDFSRKNGIQGLPLKFKDFSRLCEPWMKELKSRRNTTAHPTLSQKVLSESMAVMKKHDELNGWTEEQIVEDLIEMWKILAEN